MSGTELTGDVSRGRQQEVTFIAGINLAGGGDHGNFYVHTCLTCLYHRINTFGRFEPTLSFHRQRPILVSVQKVF